MNLVEYKIEEPYFVEDVRRQLENIDKKLSKTKDEKQIDFLKEEKKLILKKEENYYLVLENYKKGKLDLNQYDFENIGFDFEEYVLTNAPLQNKILWYAINWKKKNPKSKFRYSSTQLQKYFLDYYGVYYNDASFRKAITKLKDDGLFIEETNPEIATGEMYQDKLGRTKERVVGRIEYGKKKQKNKWYLRQFEIDYNKVFEMTCKISFEEVDAEFTPKCRKKKYHTKALMKVKALIDVLYIKVKENIRQRFKDARQMYQYFLYHIGQTTFKDFESSYLTRTPGIAIDIRDIDDEKAKKMVNQDKVKAAHAKRDYQVKLRKIELLEHTLSRPLVEYEMNILENYDYKQLQEAIRCLLVDKIKISFETIVERVDANILRKKQLEDRNYRLEQFNLVLDKKITRRVAAERLGCTERQIYNLIKIYETKGLDGLFLEYKSTSDTVHATISLDDHNSINNMHGIEILDNHKPNFTSKDVKVVNEIYTKIELPKEVIDVLFNKALEYKEGEIQSFNYYQAIANDWIKHKVFTPEKARLHIKKWKTPTVINKNESEWVKDKKKNIRNGATFL